MLKLLILVTFLGNLHDVSGQGADWSLQETEIIAKKIWMLITRPTLVSRQFLQLHPGYEDVIPQTKPSPQKVCFNDFNFI